MSKKVPKHSRLYQDLLKRELKLLSLKQEAVRILGEEIDEQEYGALEACTNGKITDVSVIAGIHGYEITIEDEYFLHTYKNVWNLTVNVGETVKVGDVIGLIKISKGLDYSSKSK